MPYHSFYIPKMLKSQSILLPVKTPKIAKNPIHKKKTLKSIAPPSSHLPRPPRPVHEPRQAELLQQRAARGVPHTRRAPGDALAAQAPAGRQVVALLQRLANGKIRAKTGTDTRATRKSWEKENTVKTRRNEAPSAGAVVHVAWG